MKLSADKFKYICPESWVAQAYGEYLADCAASQAELLSTYTDFISDESIDNLVDELSDAVTSDLSAIETQVFTEICDSGIADINLIDRSSVEYLDTFEQMYNADESFAAACDALHDEYECIPAVTSEFTARDLATWLSEHGTDYVISQSDSIKEAITDKVDVFLSDKNYNADTPYSVEDGYVKLRDMLVQLTLHASIDEAIPMDLPVYDVDGNLTEVEYTPTEVVDFIKSSFASCAAWSQGFLAMTRDNVTEALAAFDAGMATIISSAQEHFASTVATVKATISEARANVSTFLGVCDDFFGFTKIRNESYTTVKDTDVFAYTGQNPLTGINLKSAKGVAVATGKAVAAVSVAIWNGVKNLAKKVWKKAAPVVKALSSDPIDIEISNNNDRSFTITNFFYQGTSLGEIVRLTKNDPSATWSLDEAEEWRHLCQGLLGSWYSVDTYFFQFSFKLEGDVTVSRGLDLKTLEIFMPNFKFKLKPKCLSVRMLENYGIINTTSVTYSSATQYITKINSVLSDANWSKYEKFIDTHDFYLDDVTAENRMYAGFMAAIMCGGEALAYGLKELNSSFSDKYGCSIASTRAAYKRRCRLWSDVGTSNHTWVPSQEDYYNSTHILPVNTLALRALNLHIPEGFNPTSGQNPYPASVTNADFITACCGPSIYDVGSDQSEAAQTSKATRFQNIVGFDYYEDFGSDPEYYIYNVASVILPFLEAFMLQQYDKKHDPSNYVFLPYCKNSLSFDDTGRYHIKTDAQNMNAANTLLNAIILIAVVVAAMFICGAVVKVFKLRKISKFQSKIGIMDNATWNGKKLSVMEQAKYRRYARKMDKLTNASSGLAGGSSSGSILSKSVGAIKNKVLSEVDLPKSIASGTIINKQYEAAVDSSNGVSEVIRLIR